MRLFRRAVIACSLSVLLAGCPADGEYPIVGAYSLYDTGGSGRVIMRTLSPKLWRVAVAERVDRWAVVGDKLIVARRPAIRVYDGESWVRVLQAGCEYWEVDMPNNKERRIPNADKWPNVHCDKP